MPKSLVLSNCCLVPLVKSKGLLNLMELIKFLESWHNISKYIQEIFHCLEKNCPPLNFNTKFPVTYFLSKAKQKLALQIFQVSKKNITDNPLATKEF